MFYSELKSSSDISGCSIFSYISFSMVSIYYIKGRWTHFSLLLPSKQRLEFNLSQISLSFYGVVKAHLQTLCCSFTFLPPTSIQTWVIVFLCQSSSGRWKWKSFFFLFLRNWTVKSCQFKNDIVAQHFYKVAPFIFDSCCLSDSWSCSRR